MICPHCNIEMGTTYEPYEYRCTKCGYWFDTWTGKEITFDYLEGLITCSVCNDRYTTNKDGVCGSCKAQAWLDAHE